MALEISTVQATVKYCVETTAGTRPTTGYTEIPDVQTAPEVALTPDVLDASNITDEYKRYIPGQKDPGGEKTFTLNHTDACITAWAAMVTAAETGYASGKNCWFEYCFNNGTNSFFWAGQPQELGTNEVGINAVHTLSGTVICNDVGGWATASS